jgi:hypothetical protein
VLSRFDLLWLMYRNGDVDVVGWMLLGGLGIVTVGAAAIGKRAERKRAARARAWAAANGFTLAEESALSAEMQRLRNRRLPSFRGTVGELSVVVVPWRTRPRWGTVWIFSASVSRPAPLFVANRVAFSGAYRLGIGKVPGLVEVKSGDTELDARFLVQIDSPDAVERVLPQRLRAALVRAAPLLYAYTSRADGRALLFAIERYGVETQELLTAALEAFRELTYDGSSYRER